MEWSDTALVLSMGRFREYDIWLRLLTRRHGLIVAFAFGGSHSRRRFAGCLDLFNELIISVRATGHGLYFVLQEGMLVRGPRRLRWDWKRLGMFMNCVRFTEALGVPPDSAAGAFALLRDTLLLLEQAERVDELLPILFRLNLASGQGYMPALEGCSVCGTVIPERAGFLVAEGVLACAKCTAQRNMFVPLRRESLELLRHIQKESPLYWSCIGGAVSNNVQVMPEQLAPAVRRECAQAIDGFVQYHLGLIWDRGRFRRV